MPRLTDEVESSLLPEEDDKEESTRVESTLEVGIDELWLLGGAADIELSDGAKGMTADVLGINPVEDWDSIEAPVGADDVDAVEIVTPEEGSVVDVLVGSLEAPEVPIGDWIEEMTELTGGVAEEAAGPTGGSSPLSLHES